jgi:hypothetical protein
MNHRLRYSIDFPYEAYSFEPEAEPSKVGKLMRIGAQAILGSTIIQPRNSDYVKTGKDIIAGGMIYDAFELGKCDYQIANGETPPEWIYFWLRLCKGIQTLAKEDGIHCRLWISGEKETLELDSHTICSYIGSNNWTMGDYGMIMLWGVELSYTRYFDMKELCFLKREKILLPIQCRGAIFTIYDGCGIEWMLTVEDGKRIGLPTEVLSK